jgi:hypothetical protein
MGRLEIVAEGEAANPRAPPSGKRGRTRQSKAVICSTGCAPVPTMFCAL